MYAVTLRSLDHSWRASLCSQGQLQHCWAFGMNRAWMRKEMRYSDIKVFSKNCYLLYRISIVTKVEDTWIMFSLSLAINFQHFKTSFNTDRLYKIKSILLFSVHKVTLELKLLLYVLLSVTYSRSKSGRFLGTIEQFSKSMNKYSSERCIKS